MSTASTPDAGDGGSRDGHRRHGSPVGNRETYDAGFHTALMAKDVRLYLESVTAAGSPDAIGTVMDTVWQRADQAMPGRDFSEIWKYVSGR